MSLLDQFESSIMNTYGRPRAALVRGDGAVVTDETGKSYVDMFGGIAVNALGHGHPAVVKAVSDQIATLAHTSNFFATPPVVKLAERLLALTGRDGKVYFGNSGTEAVEAAIKISRLTGRTHLVATVDAFHGRTMGRALSLTGQPAKTTPFAPLLPTVTHVPFGDVEALRAAVTDETAMVIVEPVLGEAGVIPSPPGYLAAARQITADSGALLTIDEIQTGIGRTGGWFAYQAEGIEPDLVTVAKALGGGLPIGVCLAFGPAAELLTPGKHGTTFGGNPICCAAALATLDVIESEGLLDRAKTLGERIVSGIEGLDHRKIAKVRSAGMLIGVVTVDPIAARLQEELQESGYLVNATCADVIRLAPPLILTDEQADGFVAALPTALDRAGQ
ncbi:acetylornithine transaminase [Fodinicola feengrottensis]|uniref:acetylornithine transaminase n=1 Tax=Fodinicola feengrottensis TaxID=435914 RepID=UPI0024428AA4|nr:acetylornithine transaminase [Fodinicola feengrottensis]